MSAWAAPLAGGRRFIALAAALVAVGLLPVLWWGGNHDVAWLLYVARRLAHGAHLYRDLVEVNPPLVVVLVFPAELLAGALGISDLAVFDLGMAALAVASLYLAARHLRRVLGAGLPGERRFILLLGLAALFPLALSDFGQREHLILALALPYAFLAAARAEGRETPGWEAVVAGLLAGIGIALKPFYGPVWLAVEGWLVLGCRAGAPWRRGESLAIVAVLVAYPVAVLVLAPEYIALVQRLGPVYAALLRESVPAMVKNTDGVLPLLAIASLAAIRPRPGYGGLRAVMVAVLATSLLAVLLQQKGWSYHFYPTRAEALIALGVAALAADTAGMARARRATALLVGLAAALDLGVVVARRTSEAVVTGGFEREVVRGEMVPLVRRYAGTQPILALTVSLTPAFPLVNYSGAGWALRFPSLWMLPALAARENWAAESPAARATHRSADERYLIDAVTSDFVAARPALLAQYAPPWGAPDLVAYFASADPRFAGALRDYRPLATVANYRFYLRVAPPGSAPGGPPSSAQPTSDRP